MNAQIKYCKVQEEKGFNCEYGRILKNLNNRDNHEEKLSIEQYTESIGHSIAHIQRVSRHETHYCEKCGTSEHVVSRLLVGDEYYTKYSCQENENGHERPPCGCNDTSLVLIHYSKHCHNQHARCNKMSYLEHVIEILIIFHNINIKEGFLAGDDAGYANRRGTSMF